MSALYQLRLLKTVIPFRNRAVGALKRPEENYVVRNVEGDGKSHEMTMSYCNRI